MSDKEVLIEESWKKILSQEFEKPYFQNIRSFLRSEIHAGKTIYPAGGHIFNAFQITPIDRVKVVILGQDPYHGAGQAMGLSFSVPHGIKIPASLKRIYAELQRDIGFTPPNHGDLTYWAEQGVFLLNAMLTVEASLPGSHKKVGWQEFTNAVITKLSEEKEGIVFLLWGNFAKNKRDLIDSTKHHILEAAHPSPLAGKAFNDCKHFSKTNEILLKSGRDAIDWQLSS